MNKSKIEWTEATWSPVIGCTKVSAGCKHCYAEREVETRWSKNPKSIWYGRSFAEVLCRPETLAGAGSPLTWTKPRRIFVCPRADLFHDEVPDLFIADVFGVMAATPQHTYQVLTKRPERARWLLGGEGVLNFRTAVEECAAMYSDADAAWPLPNVWLGVSIEDQLTADERIPLVLDTPAAVRWISAEPLLGAVDLTNIEHPHFSIRADVLGGVDSRGRRRGDDIQPGPSLDWVVAGGESGPNASPMHPDWPRHLRDQCAAAGVPFLFKQWGEWIGVEDLRRLPGGSGPGFGAFDRCPHDMQTDTVRVGKHRAGRLLDGVLHDAYPEPRA